VKDSKDLQAFIRKVKDKVNKRKWEDWLRPGSVDVELGKLLVGFAGAQCSGENLVGWAHCEVYAGRRTWLLSSVPGSNRHAKLCYIYAMFGPDGRQELNCSKKSWESVVKLIEAQKSNPPSSALDTIRRELAVNITDVLARFAFDEAMANYAARNDNFLKRLFGGGALKTYT
jgi:hypothetical protein